MNEPVRVFASTLTSSHQQQGSVQPPRDHKVPRSLFHPCNCRVGELEINISLNISSIPAGNQSIYAPSSISTEFWNCHPGRTSSNATVKRQYSLLEAVVFNPTNAMARLFDDHISSLYTGSSLSSQTSLAPSAAKRAWTLTPEGTSYPSYPSATSSNDTAQTWSSRRGTIKSPKATQSSRLAKIKPSPALAGTPSTSQSTFDFQERISSNLEAKYIVQPKLPLDPLYLSSPRAAPKSKVKIKPLLRKLSSQEKNSIDLSRSAAENEGLGIYNSSDINIGPANADIRHGSLHRRTTSMNSNFSTATSSSNHRNGNYHVHPTRQTSQPYTPNLATSYDSEYSTSARARASSEGNTFPFSNNGPASITSLPSPRPPPPPLHLRTGSSARLTSSSQTNLPGTPSSLRRQADLTDTSEIIPHTSRSSLDSSFRKRSRTNTYTDPAAHAATVAALRQQFNEREAAKDLKAQQAEAKAQMKEAKKKQRVEEDNQRRLDNKNKKRIKSSQVNEKAHNPIPAEHQNIPGMLLYTENPHVKPGPARRRPTETAGVAGKAFQSQWSLFWFKFKTMWLKLKRKMSKPQN